MTTIFEKNVLLTGGSRGVGPVIAKELIKKGARVALAARSEEGLRRVSEKLNRSGGKTETISVDLAKSSERQRLIRDVLDRFGGIDILINNAGLETEGAFVNLSWEKIRQTVEVDLLAPVELTRLILPYFIDRGAGHVVNISSTGGKAGAPYDAIYCGTKAGLAVWTRGLRLELEGSGVRFSTIFPGYVTESGMFARFGVTPPWTIGSCTPSRVAHAVVRAIERNKREVIVNSRPIRPLLALTALSPTFGDWLMRILGIVKFQRKKVGD